MRVLLFVLHQLRSENQRSKTGNVNEVFLVFFFVTSNNRMYKEEKTWLNVFSQSSGYFCPEILKVYVEFGVKEKCTLKYYML